MNYEDFINNILETRGRFACGDNYHERHHIIPKCLNGTDEEDNLIDLFAKEHYEAHRLLALENPDVKGLIYAWWGMSTLENKFQQRYRISAEEYEEARVSISNTRKKIRGKLHPNYGKSMSLEQRKKLSEARTGKKLSPETCQKISESKKGKNIGHENPCAKQVMCEGKIFGSIVECAKYYGVTSASMRMWLRGANKMPKFFVENHLCYKDDIDKKYLLQSGCVKGKNHPNSKRIVCDNIIFETLHECSKYYNIKDATMCAWLKGRNKMPSQFKEKGLRYMEEGDAI